jgi:hypothetical protein
MFRFTSCVLVIAFAGCKSKIEFHTGNAATASASATSLKPITAKPGDIVSLTGTGFSSRQKNLVKITTARGEEVTAPVTVTSETTATFVMPEGTGLGLTSVALESNGKQMTGAMSFVANMASNALDIFIGDASEICSTKQYIDRNGEAQTGTKDCSGAVVDLSNLTSGNIKSGVTINGVTGTVTAAPANCSASGQQSCVATGAYYAGSACSADGANCFLPSYSVQSQPLKAINYSSIDQTKMLDSLTISGVTGTVAIRGSWNLTTAFPGAGYFTGTSNAPSATTILTSTTIAGVAGSATASPANCSSAGQQSCVATGTYFAGTACTANGSACYLPTYTVSSQPLKAISYDAINSSAASIRSGTTLGAVAGTLADCSTDGATGCVTTSSYKSTNMTNVTAGNIKSGVTIAGQLGDFPSATYRLTDDTATADLDAATFNAKVKSATAFEYWDSAGSRQTGAGDADIVAGNIKDMVSIFDTNGNYASAAPNAWDLRAGVTVGSTTGKLQVNCRNGATLATYDQGAPLSVSSIDTGTDYLTTAAAHGYSDNQTVMINYNSTAPGGLDYSTTYYVRNPTATTFQLSTTSGGAAIDITSGGTAPIMVYQFQLSSGTTDIWDTIDEYNGAATATPTYTGWTAANNLCGGGIEAIVDDDRAWKDVTLAGTGAASCGGSPEKCSLKDKISGLEWHNPDSTGRNWSAALLYCDNLTYNTKSDWRLPTQKELVSAYIDGIMSTANATNWITTTNLRQNYWSSSSQSTFITNAWSVNLAYGGPSLSDKSSTYRVICVRP